uniref:DUF4276 family protein n=1 Tax=Candidatus Kentrum sp. TUN TaxID=2126343 RepID=A0A451AHX9_9GAMM|nr:MAG: Domain of unknown function (DUF4276) [Candidatus Kentron sp. TUN]
MAMGKTRITLWALESDYDAEVVGIMTRNILAKHQKKADIQAQGKSPRNISKRGCQGLEKAVENYLKESRCVIFILDRDGPMSKAQRRKEPNSLINQVQDVVFGFKGRVHLVEAINELEAWFLVDCLGVFLLLPWQVPVPGSNDDAPSFPSSYNRRINSLSRASRTQ